MIDTEYIGQEKMELEDSIDMTNWRPHKKRTKKWQVTTQTTKESTEQHYLENRIWKKSYYIDISSDKQPKSHTKKITHGLEKVTLNENLNLF